jgi:hypothetical protein
MKFNMAQHTNYWSCTAFADWVRGTKKIVAGTSEEWDDWTTAAQMKHNFRYWLAEEALGHIQDFVTAPVRGIYAVKYYINNRWVTRTNSLTAHPRDIRPGQWKDVGNRFLPCLFNELVDFVEMESAWSHIACGNKEDRAKYAAPFWASGWWRWRTLRSAQAGLDHLDWAMTLTVGKDWGVEEDHKDYGKPTSQAERAKEIKELYIWWTVTYRNRPDPYDASGWTAYCEARRLANGGKMNWSGGDKSPELKKMSDKTHKLLRKIEAAYEKEDEVMMIRLIRIRDSLWT